MADKREPPPINDDENNSKDEDDLFADADDTENHVPEPEPQIFQSPEPKKEEKTRIPVDISIDSDKDDDEDDDEDLFAGGGTEVRLDSDEDEPQPDPTPAPATILTLDLEPDIEVTPDPEPEPILPTVSAEEERPKLSVTETSTASSKVAAPPKEREEDKIEEDPYMMEIRVTEPHKIGDGMGAYIVYKLITKTTIPAFKKPELIVIRRFSDFLGLHDKLREKHCRHGRIVPPAPEKSVIGMTKVKMSKEESGSTEFLERRRAALERFLNRTATHPVLRMDPDFRDFLEQDGELPKSTSTSALSGAGVKRFLSRMGDAVEKITFKMDESDEWFEEKQQQIENLETQMKKLHGGMESLVHHRRELSQSTAVFAKSTAMLGNAEEHTALSRALSQLAETEEKMTELHKEQSEQDFYVMAELLKDYVSLLGAVKEVLYERVKTYKNWKDAEATLNKKREAKAKLELARKTEKISQATQEVTDWVQRVEKGQKDFETISATVRKEVARFDRLRVNDFKSSVIQYLQNLMEKQQQMIKQWELFLPEAKAIA